MSVELLDFLEEFRQDITFADVKKIFGNDTAVANFNIAKREGFIGYTKNGKFCLTQTGEYELNRLKERKKEKQEIINIQKEQTNLSRILTFATIILAIGTLLQVFLLTNSTKFLEKLPSPNLIIACSCFGIIGILLGMILIDIIPKLYKK